MSKKLKLDEKELVRLYHKYKSTVTTGKILNCSNATVANRLKALGVPRVYAGISDCNSKPRLHLPEAQVIQFYKKTQDLAKTAKKFGCSPPKIRSVLVDNDVEVRGPFKFKSEKVLALYHRLKSVTATAAELGCSLPTVCRYIRRAGEQTVFRLRPNSSEIVRLYKELKSTLRAAKRLGCSTATIVYHLKKLSIPRSHAKGPRPWVVPPNKLTLDESAIVDMYLRTRSQGKVAKRFDCSVSVIHKILLRCGTQPDGRTPAMLGNQNPNWRGGISRLPYPPDWTVTLKESIRQRDDFRCRICRKTQAGKDGRAFAVHHIDYDKENLSPNNLVALCTECHSKTNMNRRHWTRYFRNMIRSRKEA